jgi:hypothetical protein
VHWAWFRWHWAWFRGGQRNQARWTWWTKDWSVMYGTPKRNLFNPKIFLCMFFFGSTSTFLSTFENYFYVSLLFLFNIKIFCNSERHLLTFLRNTCRYLFKTRQHFFKFVSYFFSAQHQNFVQQWALLTFSRNTFKIAVSATCHCEGYFTLWNEVVWCDK